MRRTTTKGKPIRIAIDNDGKIKIELLRGSAWSRLKWATTWFCVFLAWVVVWILILFYA